MSEAHLKTGDPLPPFNGRIRLFAMRFCPYAERCILVLNAKKIKYDLVFINLHKKPEWIFRFNPKGAVPILEYEEGKAIFESGIINSYLEEYYPDPPLLASNPLKRAQDRIVCELLSTVQDTYYTVAFNRNTLTTESIEAYHRGLKILQKDLSSRGTTFLVGDKPGLVDYTIWPFLQRFLALPLLGKPELAITEEKYSVLLKYIEALKNDPAVKTYYLSPEIHAMFIESRLKGNPKYNMLVSGQCSL
ncbi:unnamed protein product [Leptosia nina]|uniref:Uncharacterized protein n=1 Tax=Leptosia nina TaxID=320188 RepID=A0AAV1JAJ5_9NEOP